MLFRIRHPRDRNIRAEYGYEPEALAFFVHVRENKLLVDRYDALVEPYDPNRPLQGALDFLVTKGFFSRSDLEEALERIIDERPEDLPRRLRRPARVVTRFKLAAD